MNELTLEKNPQPQPASKLHRFEFTGNANEYFRIWIVNLFLSIITLGIYAAWAKVRARQYLYSNTHLDGHAFEYLGNPTSILKGNILVGVGVAVYFLAQQYEYWWLYALLTVFAMIYPYLIYKSLRFMASNSAYRNVRFKFWGSSTDAYKYYLFWMLLVPVTFGFIFPLIQFYQRKYLLDNVSWGEAQGRFTGNSSRFYTVYLTAYGIGFALYVVAMLLIFVSTFGVMLGGGGEASGLAGVSVLLGLVYVVAIVAGVALQQYIYAQIMNYSLEHTTLNDGQIRFRGKLNHWTLIKIQLVNVLVIAVTLGLMSPWAKIRYLKYVLSRVGVIAAPDALENISAAQSSEDNALGDAAVDFLDLEIGL
ncbi:YjgN family protein [Deinococcus cellulosilyticus]|uniref:DUF898 domain-containing protein n=1 Tax=Deinococcus cellulosilyticus (strain DSM 18568 / NBRC 106333 / KACC 11606 / 5516J-15) TaxID=1223518 RepID=A0A511MYM1_DEIC1|nr:YjgN family protein [Deinococcus cellulosilyticus]GEM45451.1 hypothetical protein DC3_10860 [Deinococcus cellulosilyticus NBRC 106333 = KACC 11606]